MKKSTGIRMLMRSPVKTAVTLLLIAAASFLFLYNLLDYAMTKREYTRTYDSYHGYFSVVEADRPGYRNLWGTACQPYFFVSDPSVNLAYREEKYPYSAYHLQDLTRETVEKIIDTREWFKGRLTRLGFRFPDSRANFVFASHASVPAKEIFEAARKQKIYVRYFDKARIDNYLRITIGTREEMEAFTEFLEGYLKKDCPGK